nr:hypothetical protein [Candidatus Sigynarchaeota archaeon]
WYTLTKFTFRQYPAFTDGEIDVVVDVEYPAKRNRGVQWPPTYYFTVMPHGREEKIGRVSLAIGYMDFLVKYNGQMGFYIKKDFRGHHYVGRVRKSS